jgi:hypothetical protein
MNKAINIPSDPRARLVGRVYIGGAFVVGFLLAVVVYFWSGHLPNPHLLLVLIMVVCGGFLWVAKWRARRVYGTLEQEGSFENNAQLIFSTDLATRILARIAFGWFAVGFLGLGFMFGQFLKLAGF